MKQKKTQSDDAPIEEDKNPRVDEGKLVHAIGMERTPKGWVVYKLSIRGHAVVDKEVVGDPQTHKRYAEEQLRIAFGRTFVLPPESTFGGED